MDLPTLPPRDSGVNLAEWLEHAADSVQTQLRASRSRDLCWAWMRFFTFICLPVGYYYYANHAANWGIILAVSGFLGFLISVRQHRVCCARTLTLRLLSKIIEEAQQRAGGQPAVIRSGASPANPDVWSALMDELNAGSPGKTISPQEIDDLDLFGGPLSLFGLINRASTPPGSARLADLLTRPLSAVEPIRERQAAVKWLAEHEAERLHVTAAAAGLRPLRDECEKLYDAIRNTPPLPNRGRTNLLRLWGLVGPITLVITIVDLAGWAETYVGSLPMVIACIVNMIVVPTCLKPVRERIRAWLELDTVVTRLLFFTEVAAESLPGEGLLGRQRDRLDTALQRGRLPTLESRIPLLFLGYSGIFHAMIDILVLWDLQVLCLLENCYVKHRDDLLGVFAALAECEAFVSLGCFAAEEPDTSWPTYESEGQRLEIVEGRHPLIPVSEAVRNSLSLVAPVTTWLLTGSNMSGKSTFLRMAGTNVLLAQTGSAVAAERLHLSLCEILTDLRIRDDLSRKESYFLAEVRQVKRMVEAARANQPVFCLIDEPFRGTNSGERLAAATAVAHALIHGSGLHLIATHDAALTSLGELPRAENRHFQESFAKDQLVFDYKLRPGPAESRNALRVLQAEGYPADLVARATTVLNEIHEPMGEPQAKG